VARPRSTFPAVPAAQAGGVSVGQHTLTKQAEQLESLNRRIGRRLAHWLRTHPDQLPDAEFVETYHRHSASLIALLKEQRERAKDGGPPVPTEVLTAQLRHEFADAAGTFDDADLELLARNLKPEAWATLDRVRAEMETDRIGQTSH
jgi:hypothetical protein